MDEAKPKLLLADDSATIRKVIELTFHEEGIEVTTAGDAQRAMQRFVEVQPDIVLVDVGLEGTSGYQICEMIKNDDATRHIPVLLLVGSFEPFDPDEAERVRADGFLTKPFHSIRDLVARVSDLLGRSDVGDAVAPPPTAIRTEDIDQLYNRSFAETAQLDELDTVDDLLGDAGMDDELIETTYPSEPLDDDILAFETTDEIPESDRSFDWSEDAVISDFEPVQKAHASFEPKFAFAEESDHDFSHQETADASTIENLPGLGLAEDNTVGDPRTTLDHVDDDTIESQGPAPGNVKDNTIENPLMTLEIAEDRPVARPPAGVDHVEYSPIGEAAVDTVMDNTIENLSAARDSVEDNPIDTLPAVEDARYETIENLPPAIKNSSSDEPSPEFIELVAQLVIEKLSDRVVREIAQDTVPRVAEKVIREALSQPRNSDG